MQCTYAYSLRLLGCVGVISINAAGEMLEPTFILKGGKSIKLDLFKGTASDLCGEGAAHDVVHGPRVTLAEKGCQTGRARA